MPVGATRVSLDEFLSMPDESGVFFDFHELHNGEIVRAPAPAIRHVVLQRTLEGAFTSLIGSAGLYEAYREFYYTLETEARRADVAVVSVVRFRAQEGTRPFYGGPDVVVEVLSPWNSAMDLAHLRRRCFENGTETFWVVDPSDKAVEVYRVDGSWNEYRTGQRIPFRPGGIGGEIPVDAIFAGSAQPAA